MSDTVSDMIRRLLGRQPTSEDYRTLDELLRALPDDILASPAAVADIVLRMEYLHRLEATVKQAGWDAQQRIHTDLPKRVDKAAEQALYRLRDKLPIDAADRVSRLLKWGVAWSCVVALVAGTGGWMLAHRLAGHAATSQRAASERAFNACIDAAEGAAGTATDRRTGSVRYDRAAYSTRARLCAAEFADRHLPAW